MSFLSRRTTAFAVPILLALLSSTCAEAPTGDRHLAPRRSNLSIATSFSPGAKAAAALIHAAGLDVDRVQVLISLTPTETLRDTTIAFVAGQDQTLDLDVPVDPGTSLTATVNYYAGTVLLYTGSATVIAYAPGTPADQIPKATIVLVAVAPGAAATRVTVAGPAPSPITAPVTLTAHAFLASDAEIANAIFGWSVDDETIATISGAGVLTPTAKSGTVQVTAITLSGISATTPVTFYGPAARIITVSGDAQTAEVGAALPLPFVVQVQSATGAAVPNQTVTFGAANASSVAPTTATTDANGRAQTVPTLGTTPGTVGFTATAAGFTTPISATATTAAPATISVVSGDAQSDTIQKALKNPLVVKVVDRFGNPTVGVIVAWARTAGSGAVSAANTTTDAAGQTSITYTLGAAVGNEAIAASFAGVTTAATFTATALPKPASFALQSGGGQTGTVGKPLATQIAVRVLDTQGNPSPNVTVTFAVATGGGSVAPTSATTDATGVAKTTWTLGATVGAQTMTASAAGLSGSPITVSATGITAPAVGLQFAQQPSQVASGVAIAPAVTVRAVDADGNTVTGFAGTVTVAIGTNPGSATLGGTLTQPAVNGVATFGDLTLNRVANGYTLQASATGMTSIVSAAFNVTTPAIARVVVISGDNQTGEVGTPLPQPFVVEVQSATNTPVAGQTVTFAATNGALAAPASAVTDAAGRAQTTMTLGNTPGTYTFTATTAGFTATVTATAGVGPAASITIVSGDAQSDTVQKTLITPLLVRVADRFGNPKAGVTVGWSRISGAGSVSAPTTTTAADGSASITYTLGATAGTEKIGASVGGVTTGVQFTETALPKPTSIALLSGGGQSGVTGKALTQQIAFKVLDTQGNPSPNVVVTFAVTGGGGSLNPTSATTDATGVVKTTWTLGTTVGTQTMTASATGLTGSPVSVSATATAPAAVALQFVQGPSAVGAGVVMMPAVKVRAIDADGNVVPSFTGNIAIAIGTNPSQGALGGTLTRAAVSGVATFNDLTVSVVGNGYTLAASSAGLTGVVSAAFDVTTPPTARIEWANPQGGNWSLPSNWNLNRVPVTGDSVLIALAGTYTVNMDATFTGSVLVIGGGSGQQTLSVVSRSETFSTAVAVKSSGVLRLSNSSVVGAGTITNEGTIVVPNGASIGSALVTAPGSVIRVASDGSTGAAAITFNSGFTNHGLIDLSSTLSSYQSGLIVVGTLVNAADGTISASLGTGGTRSLDGALDNRGHINLLALLQLSNTGVPNAAHSNTGTIDVTGGDFNVVQSGTVQTFTNDGTVNVGSGRTWNIVNGTVTQTATSIQTGAGGIKLTNATGGFNGDITLGALTLQTSIGNFQRPLSTATMAISIDGSTIAGPITLTNAATKTLSMRNSSISSAFDNRGTLLVIDAGTLSGAVTTAQGSTMRVYSDGQTGTAQMAVSSSFTNNGTIELTSTVSGYESILNVAGFALTNSPTGIINALPGTGGARTLAGQLINQGVVNVQNSLFKLGATSVAHTNSGSINLINGDVQLLQTGGGSGTFTNADGATIAISAGRTFSVGGGVFNVQAQSTLSGAGTLAIDNATGNFSAPYVLGALTMTNNSIANLSTDLSTASTVVSLTNATINGPGRLINAATKTMTIKASIIGATGQLVNQGTLIAVANNTVNGALTQAGTITVQSDGSVGTAVLTVANGFTNDGTLNLSSTVSGYTGQLTVTTGTFTNGPNGIINAAVGTGGPRVINAVLSNQGAINVNAPLTVSRANTAQTNFGLITVSGANFSIDYANTTGSFTDTGVINLAAGRTFSLTGGTLSEQGNVNGAGTLTLTNVDGTFSAGATLPSVVNISGGTQTFGSALSTAATAFGLVSTTVNANAGFINSVGKTLTMRQSAIVSTATVENDGTANFIGDNAINAPFTTTSTSRMNVYADGIGGGSANLSLATGFTNNGILDLSSVTAGYSSSVSITSGNLVNASGATISASAGAGGSRAIVAPVINQGTITVNAQLSLTRVGSAHQNNGTITLNLGDLIITQGGTSPSFSNTGTITIPAARSLSVSGGSFTNGANGIINGGGALIASGVALNMNAVPVLNGLYLLSGTVANSSVALSTASMVIDISGSGTSLGGTGSLLNASGGQTLTIEKGATISMPLTNNGTLNSNGVTNITSTFTTGTTSVIEVYTDGIGGGTGQLNVSNSFTNNGKLELTTQTAGYPVSVNVSNGGGTLTNAAGAMINTLTGLGGSRTITGSVSNTGIINIATGTSNGLSITGTYTSGGAPQINLVLASATDYSTLHTNTLSGTSTIAGQVNVTYANGFTATTGQAFTILSFGVSPVIFATFNLPGGEGVWNQANSGSAYTITHQ